MKSRQGATRALGGNILRITFRPSTREDSELALEASRNRSLPEVEME